MVVGTGVVVGDGVVGISVLNGWSLNVAQQ